MTDSTPVSPPSVRLVAARTLYRIVKTNPPTIEDFKSQKALGRRLRDQTSEAIRCYDGVSFWENEAQARAIQQRFPTQGQFLARLVLPAGTLIRIDRTFRPGHWTIWAEPAELLALVVEVVGS